MTILDSSFHITRRFFTCARCLPAFRAAALVFVRRGGFQVDSSLAGKADKPGEYIRELPGEFHSLLVANGACQLADFLNKPAKRTINSAGLVFGEIQTLNPLLKLPDLHQSIILNRHPLSSDTQDPTKANTGVPKY